MLKASAFVLVAAFAAAAWVLAPGLSLSSATTRSYSSQPAPVEAVASEPAIANYPFMKIVPAESDGPSEVFIGTGDHSAGVWTK
jgi:hypothetical protein